jgi:predicted ATPase/class 3 adenylate cyclase
MAGAYVERSAVDRRRTWFTCAEPSSRRGCVTDLPSGTVTFLFTDLEGSTRLWELYPDEMRPALAHHDSLLRDVVIEHRGSIVKTTGDGVHAVFTSARDAVDAAVDAQGRLATTAWECPESLKVRMGIHTGETELRDGDYFGSAVNRAARLMSIAHGGQVVLSATSATLVEHASVELRDLGEHRLAGLTHSERVWQVSAPGLDADFPPLRSLDARDGNLPRRATSFIGREQESIALANMVQTRPLVTLTGVGGVGKTRLALEVAARVAAEFPDGVWVCELAPLTDPDAIWDALAAALGVSPSPGRSIDQVVLDTLRGSRLLLVLDNCEHLLDGVARTVEAIGAHCSGVKVLATSREGLAIAGEQIVAVPSLAVPTAEDAATDLAGIESVESVELFCARARAVRSEFELDHTNCEAVALLCRRLDGIPLAIELAAARVRSLTPDDIVERLDQRFQLLARGGRAALERHQTLRNTIDWSYQLLDDRERVALDRISVFAGGCDLDAAESVLAGDVLEGFDVADVLGHLVDKSLVLAEPDTHGRLRYRLLEMIRQYAQERLEASGDARAVRRRHADHFVALAEAAERGLRSPEQLDVAAMLVRESDNLRAAFDWAIEAPSVDHAMRLVASLAVDRVATGELALSWSENAVAVPGATEHPRFTDVAAWAINAAARRGDADAAARYLAAIDAAEARQDGQHVSASHGRAIAFLYGGQLDLARTAGEEWVARARRDGDPYQLSGALIQLSLAQSATGHHDVAVRNAEEGLELARASGVPSMLAVALFLVPWSLLDDDPGRARQLFDEAIDLAGELGDPLTIVMALTGKGVYHASEGEWDLALAQVRDATDRLARLATAAGVVGGLLGVAGVVLTALRRLDDGAVILGASYRFAPGAYRRPEQLRQEAAETLAEGLGRAEFEARFAEGRALEADDALSRLRAALLATR